MAFGKRTSLMDTAAGEAIAAASATGEPVTRVQLLPIGQIVSKRDGRRWLVRDLAHAQEIVAATVATATPAEVPIDYDHQLVTATQEGGPGGTAKAAGWMRNFQADANGISAEVEWTAAADAALRAKEYRYISPFFGFSKASGEITRIFHAGLTNFPAITELAAVASAGTGDSMDLTALAAALGLPATATLEEIVAAATAARAAAAAQLTALAAAAGVPAATTVEAVSTAIAAAKAASEPDPRAFVPMASFKELQGQVKQLLETGAASAAATAVDAACAAGKITPAGREHALKLYAADPAAFAEFVGSAPVVVKPGVADTAAASADLNAPLTAEEKAAASAIGISEEAFLASKKQLAGVS
jgi:phage I-like protein